MKEETFGIVNELQNKKHKIHHIGFSQTILFQTIIRTETTNTWSHQFSPGRLI
jgi:hypothetical protein